MRTVQVNDSLSVVPSSYDADYSSYDLSNAERGYADSDSTNYAQIGLTRGSQAVTYFYYKFDTSSIPATAEIDSITVSAKIYINNTNANYVATRQAQMFSGTTAKGSAYTVSNSTTAFTISAGTWTRSELNDLRIRLYAVRGTSNVNTSYYFRFYGAEVTISYHYDEHYYTITASSNVPGVTIQPASQELLEGKSAAVVLSDNSNIVVTDNGADVTSQLTPRSASGTLSGHPVTVGEVTFAINNTYPPEEALADTSSTDYARFNLTNTQQHAIFGFDASAIPPGVNILSVECRVKGYVSSASGNITVKQVQLYAGGTAKGSPTTLPTSNQTFSISSTGSWTAAEVQDIKLRVDGRASATYYIYLYGASLTVTYADNGTVYVYTMSNLSADHTILVVLPYTLYAKVNGAWKLAKKVLVKRNGGWVEATDVLAKDNGQWK